MKELTRAYVTAFNAKDALGCAALMARTMLMLQTFLVDLRQRHRGLSMAGRKRQPRFASLDRLMADVTDTSRRAALIRFLLPMSLLLSGFASLASSQVLYPPMRQQVGRKGCLRPETNSRTTIRSMWRRFSRRSSRSCCYAMPQKRTRQLLLMQV